MARRIFARALRLALIVPLAAGCGLGLALCRDLADIATAIEGEG